MLLANFSSESISSNSDINRITYDSDTNGFGIGRYSRLTRGHKLYYYITTAKVDRTVSTQTFATDFQENESIDLTNGQRLGLSYVYDPSSRYYLAANIQQEDSGTEETQSYGIHGDYYLSGPLTIGAGFRKGDEFTQVSINIGYNTFSQYYRSVESIDSEPELTPLFTGKNGKSTLPIILSTIYLLASYAGDNDNSDFYRTTGWVATLASFTWYYN